MADYQFSNNASTTLDAALTSGATSLNVVSASAFPASGQFAIIIDSEILLVTGVSGTTWTVARAQEGTSAAAHDDGATVTHVLTKGALDQFLQGPLGKLRLTRETDQNIETGAAETLVLDTEADVNDEGDDFDHSNGVITVNRTDWYDIVAGVSWANNSTGVRKLDVYVDSERTASQNTPAANSQIDQTASSIVKITAGSTVYAQVVQDSGSTIVARGVGRTFLAIARRG